MHGRKKKLKIFKFLHMVAAQTHVRSYGQISLPTKEYRLSEHMLSTNFMAKLESPIEATKRALVALLGALESLGTAVRENVREGMLWAFKLCFACREMPSNLFW